MEKWVHLGLLERLVNKARQGYRDLRACKDLQDRKATLVHKDLRVPRANLARQRLRAILDLLAPPDLLDLLAPPDLKERKVLRVRKVLRERMVLRELKGRKVLQARKAQWERKAKREHPVLMVAELRPA